MQFAFPLTLLLACSLVASAQQPDPAPPETAEGLVAKLNSIRAQQAELLKQETAVRTALAAKMKQLQDAIDRANGVDPKPPAPQPTPPKPPEPAPPPAPVPADPLKVKLKAALDADPATTELKREQAKDLAALYRSAAKLAEDAKVPTSGELLRRVRDAAGTLIGPDSLKEVRRVAGSELGALLPTDADLTDAQRTGAAELFTKLAAALEELAK